MESGAMVGLLIAVGTVMWLLHFTIKSAIKDAYKEMDEERRKEIERNESPEQLP